MSRFNEDRSGRQVEARRAGVRRACILAAGALAAGLTACSSYSPPAQVVGQTVEQVQQAMGPATGRYTLPDGSTRLEFARGPFGRHTWMLDLGPDGRVKASEQVLTDNKFATLREGDTRESVLQRIGQPSEVRGGGLQGGEVWSWRYDDRNNCLWFEVSMINARVVHPSYGIDPRCNAGGNDRS